MPVGQHYKVPLPNPYPRRNPGHSQIPGQPKVDTAQEQTLDSTKYADASNSENNQGENGYTASSFGDNTFLDEFTTGLDK